MQRSPPYTYSAVSKLKSLVSEHNDEAIPITTAAFDEWIELEDPIQDGEKLATSEEEVETIRLSDLHCRIS